MDPYGAANMEGLLFNLQDCMEAELEGQTIPSLSILFASRRTP